MKNEVDAMPSAEKRRVGDAWGCLRGVLLTYSTSAIKQILTKAGLPILRIEYQGTYKEPFLTEVDTWLRSVGDQERDRFCIGCIEETVAFENARSEALRQHGASVEKSSIGDLENCLARVGFGLSGKTVYPLSLQLDVEATALPSEIGEALAEALGRYRDGRFAGAITSICGAVDRLAQLVFVSKGIEDNLTSSYQERISKAFSSLEAEYRGQLDAEGVKPDEVRLVWENHRKSVSQAAYVLGAFRREFSDVHGEQNAPRAFVQKALDCAVFIVRSFSSLLPAQANSPS